MSSFDDEDFWERYQKAWKEGRLRWLDIDITPIYRALGGDDEKRKFFSFIGHFRDPLKFITKRVEAAKHKSSITARLFLEGITGTNWQDRPFTTLPELIGVDDKGRYKTSRKGKFRKGQPKGGKLKGKLVSTFRGSRGAVDIDTFPSFALHSLRSITPIQVQSAISWLSGEIDGFDAMSKSLGFMTSTTYPDARTSKRRTR